MNSTTTQGQIQFIQNHQTALDAGEYEIAVTQTIQINGTTSENDTFNSKLKFAIYGNRFGLQPQDIHAVFPPENSLGDHAHVLPHIALKSSTLPWERLVHPDAPQDIPWLALLLLHEGEKPLRTIQKEDFFKAKLYDQQGKEISNDTKTNLWRYLSKPVSWLRLIGNDEAIIVEKEAREILSLSGDFAVFDSQVEALLASSNHEKLLRTIQKEDFIKAKLYDQQRKEIVDETKANLWEHLLSDAVYWLRSIGNDEAIIVEKEARKLSKLINDFAVFDDQVKALLASSNHEKLLRTIQKEDFFKAKLYDQQGKEISNDTKTNLWRYLSNPVSWLRLIENEAIIVEKEAREIPSLSGDFAVFDSQVEALLAPSNHEKLLRTIQEEYFFQFRLYDRQGEKISDKIKKELWQYLLSNDVYWLRPIENDEAIIVEKEARKSLKLSGNFAIFNNQIQALLTQGQREKLLRTIQKEDFIKAKFYDQQRKEISNDTKTNLWQYLLSNDVSWLRPIENDEAIIVEKEAREIPSLSGDFAVFDSQVEALLAQFRDIKLVTLEKLKAPSRGTIKWPGTKLEIGQKEKDQASVIDVPKKLLLQILPTTQELQYLAHVRQTTGDPESGEPLSIVVSNRLPKQNGTSTAYLVTLENRYRNSDTFDDQGATDQDYIRLVVLKSWSFTCSDPEQDFKGLLKNLNVGTLQLPNLHKSAAGNYLAKGYVALHHYLRQGGKTFSWYHSPLLPGENTTNLELSQFAVRCADQLIAYDEKNGLFDISYAAAWQLGQLLALQDKKLAINLFNWKRANAQKLAKDNQQALYPHLFPTDSSNAGDSLSLPEDIATWFNQLALLSGVPFNYLVPDDKMLPPESIRFFWLDWFWVESLLDGAFSIGRVHESNPELDKLPSQVKQITGCLIRSEVVAGWPDLQINASASFVEKDQPMQDSQKLTLLRRDRLSQDVLICLFEGEIQTLDISLKPEGLHFGFNSGDGQLHRELRSLDGTEKSDWKIAPIPWNDVNQRIVNINRLANDINEKLRFNPFTSAQFALQMVQGAELVRFQRS